jgi:hypothetical protein
MQSSQHRRLTFIWDNTMKNFVIGSWLAILGLGFYPATQAATSCDESCLRTIMDKYLDAMVAHDPARLPRAKKFRFTENGVEIAMEDGLWATATGTVGYRIYVPDPAKQSIAFMGNVTELGKTVYFGVRLKLVDGRISEAETQVARGVFFPAMPGNAAPPTASPSARASLAELTPEADRLPRAKLIELSEKYFDALQDGDGDLAPFATDCVRIENGIAPMTPPGGKRETCYDNIEHSPPFTRIVKRRVLAVDESRNTVMWVADFSMPGVESPRMQAWRRTASPQMLNLVNSTVRPSSGPLMELFRIRNGQLAEIEAVYYFPRIPYGFGTGWDRPEER